MTGALEFLAATGSDLLEAADITLALERFYEGLAGLLQLDLYLHYELSGGNAPLRLLVAGGVPEAARSSVQELSLGEAVCGTVGRTGTPWVVDAVQSSTDPRATLIRSLGIQAYACHPLLRHGVVLGTLSFGSSHRAAFDDDTVAILHAVAAQVAMVIHRRQTEALLRDGERRRDEFLAVLAHELRNPLAPLRSGLDMLALTVRQDHDTSAIIERMTRQLGNVVRLVDDLMDVARIKTGKLHAHREPMRLADALHDAVETIQPVMNAKQQTFRVVGVDREVLLQGDRVRLAQVFANLLNNAAKYTPRGGTIVLRLAAEGPAAVVSIEDDGPGVAAEDLPRIFDPFVQGSGRGFGDGFGVGLSLAKTLVELHDGRIDVTQRPGGGAVFRVILPADVGAAVAASPSAAGASDAPAAHRRRVLVVDDNVDAADALCALIEFHGDVACAVNDGAAAVGEAQEFRPDIIFMDLGMSGVDGIEATRRIRQLHLDPEPVICALTGWGQPADREATASAGFDRHLVKPAAFEAIAAVLESARRPASRS